MQIRYQRMRKAFHNSPYHINAPVKDDHQGSRPDVRRYMDKESHQDTKTNKVALHQACTTGRVAGDSQPL